MTIELFRIFESSGRLEISQKLSRLSWSSPGFFRVCDDGKFERGWDRASGKGCVHDVGDNRGNNRNTGEIEWDQGDSYRILWK